MLRSSPRSLLMIAGICAMLSACDEDDARPAPDVRRLATDVHVAIAGQNLVLPFVALEFYAYRGLDFYLDRGRDSWQGSDAAEKLLRNAADPEHPFPLTSMSVVVETYGWNDSDMRQRDLCPLLTREWTRSVCDNPWAAVRQALPYNRFKLVDLREVQADLNCPDIYGRQNYLSLEPGKAEIVCRTMVYTSGKYDSHTATVRISGDLGAIWTVWGHGQRPESAEAMTRREGEAIVALVRDALGATEHFATLHHVMCRLRRPGAADSPKSADCSKG